MTIYQVIIKLTEKKKQKAKFSNCIIIDYIMLLLHQNYVGNTASFPCPAVHSQKVRNKNTMTINVFDLYKKIDIFFLISTPTLAILHPIMHLLMNQAFCGLLSHPLRHTSYLRVQIERVMAQPLTGIIILFESLGKKCFLSKKKCLVVVYFINVQ